MNIRQFGAAERPAMVLIHPSLVTWDYYRDVIPFLESDHRLFVPALPLCLMAERNAWLRRGFVLLLAAEVTLSAGVLLRETRRQEPLRPRL